MFHGLYLGKVELKLTVTSKLSPAITVHALTKVTYKDRVHFLANRKI